MLFSSATFIFIFLPIICVLYFLARNELRNYILLIGSLLFYAWGEPRYLAIMLLTILTNYLGALAIERYPKRKSITLILGILVNLSFLFYFKYFNFAAETINSLCKLDIQLIKVIMPIGISFYTFQAMSYLVDVYRGEVAVQKDIYKLSLYVTLFPQLVAGPIVKYHDVAEQISNREVTFHKVTYGVKRFIIGLAKKMILANSFGEIADSIFNQPVANFDTATAWVGAIAYSLQLYFDFSGYSDMAIGLGTIFGFKFLENFNYPYISKSITEFWRRWHISLSTWFKEYLYIPLGGNRVSLQRTYINLFIVFLATGIWHGASWNFVIWGLWHGFFIIMERATGWHKKEGGNVLNTIKHIYTIFIFVIGWVMFRADNMSYAWDYLKNMFGLITEHTLAYTIGYYVGTSDIILFGIAVICSIPIFRDILQITPASKHIYSVINIWLLVLFTISVSLIAASTYNPFIYFRF